MNRRIKAVFSIITLVFWSAAAKAENPLETHLLVDLLARNTNVKGFSNTTPYGASNFHALRIRLFLEKRITDKVDAFTQFLSDNADAPTIYAAYIRFRSGNSWLIVQAGRIPYPFGSWGPRTTSDKNPLIGIPLGFNYQTALLFEDLQVSPAELLNHRGQGSIGEDLEEKGLPIVSDATWNTGISLFGGNNKLDYTVGLLSGSLSYPTTEPEKAMPQFSGRIAFTPVLGWTIGTSFGYGPYLENNHKAQLPPASSVNKFYQRIFGWDLSFERGKFIGHSEAMVNRWTHPYILEPLDVYSGYVEGVYKFATQFFFATRYDRMEFSKIADPSGGRSVWDFPLYRLEAGMGYHFDRNVTFKIVGQFTRYPGQRQFNDDILATQISTNF